MQTNAQKHYKAIRNILLGILLLNWGVSLAKIIYGQLSHCISMTADGIHSLADGASNIIGLIGINIASKPQDKEHPYGHKKYETFFSLAIAAVLVILAFNLIKEGINRFFHPVIPQIDTRNFVVMIVTLTINLLVMNYEHKKGVALKSDMLVSDAMHTKADVFTSLSVIVALVVIKLGYPILDPIATIIIAFFIARTGFGIAQEGSKILCDTAVIVDVKKIEDIVSTVSGVKTCHKIRTRGRPDDIYIDLHVLVNPEMRMKEAHKISSAIEEAIKKDIPEITDVVVHMEPGDKC